MLASAPEIRAMLTGGDRRSIARSNQLLERVRRDPGLVAAVAALASDPDWLVSLRALDLLEKLAHEHADWVEPHRHLFLGPLADSDKWEMHLQIVRALPLFRWNRAEKKRATAILLRDLEHPKTFVKAWALDSLAAFAIHDPALMPVVREHLEAFEHSGSNALAARARRIRAGRLSPPNLSVPHRV